ncbi:hypothetical protein R3P38DRAFT_2587258, partial [Favolaschia claudopus]
IVAEVVKKIPSAQKQKGGKAAKRSATQRDRAKRAQQAEMPREFDIVWKRVIREIWRGRYEIDKAEDFSSYASLDKADMQRCNKGYVTPDEDDYTLFLGVGWKSCLWNHYIISKLANQVQDTHEEDPANWGLPTVSSEYIAGLFWNQVTDAQRYWAEMKPRVLIDNSSGLPRYETAAEVQARVTGARRKRGDDSTDTSRKTTKFKRRKGAAQTLVKLKKKTDPDRPTWVYFVKVMQLLGKNGMSSDESDTLPTDVAAVPVFKTKLCKWRANTIDAYVGLMDSAADDMVKGRGGANRTIRIRSEEVGTSEPPPGLPEAMYDEEWLAEQRDTRPDWVETVLRVSKKKFDLLEAGMEDVKGKGKARA